MTMANTSAYYDTATITAVKSVQVENHDHINSQEILTVNSFQINLANFHVVSILGNGNSNHYSQSVSCCQFEIFALTSIEQLG